MSQGYQQQSHSYYVDDIPIVITEKWRLPPLPNIPEDLVRPFFKDRTSSETSASIDDENNDQGHYNFTLEQKVLDKINEWKSLQEKELHEREERLKQRREELQKQIEVEETRLKERLTQVSYPSPDDFSSSSSDEEAEKQESTDNKNEEQVYQGTFFDSILKPTVIQSRPSSATDVQLRAKRSQAGSLWSGTSGNNANKIELADFENDATDPFYNVELKTIDDLDVLAQVLKSSNLLHSKDKSKESVADSKKHEEKGNIDQVKQESENKEVIQNIPQPPSTLNGFVSSPPAPSVSTFQSYSSYAPSYSNYGPIISNSPIVSNGNPSFVSPTNGGFGNVYSNQISSLNTSYAPNYNAAYMTNNFAYQHHNVTSYQANQQEPHYQPVSNLMDSKLRSKSVPDICQELEDEVKDSERRRIRNNSQSTETARNTAHNSRFVLENNSNNGGGVATKNNSCDEILKPLPIELQNLIRNISQMGFPVDLVFRVAEQFQGDDKRIIEHLIPLSELLDLGFEEKQVSEALIKFNNNKEKALDFLIT